MTPEPVGYNLTPPLAQFHFSGTRKKVGFAYDMLADTATDVANEMVDNLSLDCSEADYIASLIQVSP